MGLHRAADAGVLASLLTRVEAQAKVELLHFAADGRIPMQVASSPLTEGDAERTTTPHAAASCDCHTDGADVRGLAAAATRPYSNVFA